MVAGVDTLDDFIVLADDSNLIKKDESNSWKVLIVDDEESVHSITKITMADFEFECKSLVFLDAYSEYEAKEIIDQNSDIAIILLDVVMEKDDSGLNVIRYLREYKKNLLVRIILRTGQPGQAPEKKVIVDYDINDYKLKTELTADRLFISILTALRSFRDLKTLDYSKKGLEKIMNSSSMLYRSQSFDALTEVVLKQTNIVVGNNEDEYDKFSGFVATRKNECFYVDSAVGEFEYLIGNKIEDANLNEEFEKILKSKSIKCINGNILGYFESSLGIENVLYLKNLKKLEEFEKDLLEIFFANISMAFNNYYLKEEINSFQKEIIFTLGEIAESRSNETGFHIRRVAEYARVLSEKYGFSEEESELISIASTMHDVGKIAIPDAILNKPGKLTIEEFDIIKTHSQIGYDMLKKSKGKVVKIAAAIALSHHEKFNGKGYPQKLSGEEINVYARIVAIADVFDALSAKRVYKEAWDIDKIIELFEAERGEHFDPKFTDILLNSIDEFLKIKNAFPE